MNLTVRIFRLFPAVLTTAALLTVSSLQAEPLKRFLDDLRQAAAGDTVYIEAGAVLDMTGLVNIKIPAGVTVMGRGEKEEDYPLLFSDYVPQERRINPLFLAGGDGVTVAKIRLRGPYNPDREIDVPGAAGIRNRDYSGMTVKECQIFLWEFSGIVFDYGSRDNRVTNCFIHSNNRPGYGYGVAVGKESFAVIEHNRFDYNRHDIAGTGCPESGYTARYNIVGENGTSHSFDMHGGFDRGDGTDYAGCCIIIENNIFRIKNHWAVAIRGVPASYGIIRNNRFYGQKNNVRANSVKQLNAFGRLRVGPNYYEFDYQKLEQPGWIIQFAQGENKESALLKDFSLAQPEWLLQTNYSFEYAYTGDFNGDGLSDVLIAAASGRFYVSPGALVSWQKRGELPLPALQVLSGDFNGSGSDDILAKTEEGWYLAENDKFEPADDLQLEAEYFFSHDFNGDGRSDILFFTDERWYILKRLSSVETYNMPFAGFKEIAAGDYTGDGRTEIFWQQDGFIHFYGQETGTVRTDITAEVTDIHLADFTGDSVDELFFADGSEWRLYSYLQDEPVTVKATSLLTNQLLFGDFNGSGMTDIVFRYLKE